jgi:hypothetical protein
MFNNLVAGDLYYQMEPHWTWNKQSQPAIGAGEVKLLL